MDQCPSFSVVTDSGKPVKDYSDLINPRVLPKDIVAETEDADTLDLSAGELSTKSVLYVTTLLTFHLDICLKKTHAYGGNTQ